VLKSIIFWVTQKRWFLGALFLGIILYNLDTPDQLSDEGYRTLIIVLMTIILIIFEPIPLPGVAMLILIAEVLFGVVTADEAATSFMSDAVFFIMGSLMIAVAIINQGLDARLALVIIRITGNKTWKIMVGFVVISAFLSSFIGEHTVAALMLPIALTLIRNTSKKPEKVKNLSALLLFSIAYGSLAGSIGTPSGGGRNAIMLSYLKDFEISVSYLEWIILVYPLIIILLPILIWILWKSFTPEYYLLDSGVRKLVVHVAKSGKTKGEDWIAIGIFILVFLGWVLYSETVGLGIIALMGVFLYMVTGIVNWSDLSRNTNWGVVILFGATISLGYNIKYSGAATWLANRFFGLFDSLIDSLPLFTDFAIITITTIMANVLSSSATVAVLGPITTHLGNDALHLGMVTAIASSFGYFTVVAAPACTIIYSSGLIKAKEFLKIGWKMGLISIMMALIYTNTYWVLFE